MSAGYEGAQRFHRVLRQETFQCLLEQGLISRGELMDPSVITSVYVYANLCDMALLYAQRRAIHWPEDFLLFFHGFNAGMPNHRAALISQSPETLKRGSCFFGAAHPSFRKQR